MNISERLLFHPAHLEILLAAVLCCIGSLLMTLRGVQPVADPGKRGSRAPKAMTARSCRPGRWPHHTRHWRPLVDFSVPAGMPIGRDRCCWIGRESGREAAGRRQQLAEGVVVVVVKSNAPAVFILMLSVIVPAIEINQHTPLAWANPTLGTGTSTGDTSYTSPQSRRQQPNRVAFGDRGCPRNLRIRNPHR